MEKIKFISEKPNNWNVSIGSQTLSLLKRKGIEDEQKDSILKSSSEILESCGNPNNISNSETGLVIGYVQSGKTLSFTTLAALASQNGFNVIIIIAGSTTKLVDQTTIRLENDLDINNKSEISWKLHKNPKTNKIEEILCDMEEGLFDDQPVLLITVMKNTTHLKNLKSIFVSSKIKQCDFKVLIIDDEADQASLNTQANKKNELNISSTYRILREIRSSIKNHTYLQYTATPQAPLFISILDILSPNFVKILNPGNDYTGGKTFFRQNKDSKYPYIIDIAEEEIYSKNNVIKKIPNSLVEAMMYFFLTVAIGVIKQEHPKTHTRTMMIHPSQLQNIHSIYEMWVVQLTKRWVEELSLRDNDPDKINIVKSFKNIYKKLIIGTDNTLDFDEVFKKILPVIKKTPIILSNSSVEYEINWKKDYSMILVGGQVLDRGFTVEGLNITYMPRSIGVGNADTIQQRCRFFGYKRKYLDMCRIFLPRKSKRAYIDYVLHEEDLRNKLIKFSSKNRSLKEFKREFLLSPELNITRKNVISDDLKRYRLQGWRPIVNFDSNYLENNNVINEFISSLNLYSSSFSGDNELQKHEQCEVSYFELFNNLLLNLKYTDPTNSLLVNHIFHLLSVLKDTEENNVLIVNMSLGKERKRSLNEQKVIRQLFQGSNIKTNYNGDRSVMVLDKITVQIHNVLLTNNSKIVKTLAFYIPKNLGQNLISLDNS